MTGVRLRSLVAAVITIAAGLLVHTKGAGLGAVARDVLGDALWACMIYWLMSAVAIRAPLALRAIASYAVCVAVEFSQLFHTSSLDALRATFVGHLVLGSGFDPRDLVAYAFGVCCAAQIERLTVSRNRDSLELPH